MSNIGSRTQTSERDEKDVSGQNSEAAAGDGPSPVRCELISILLCFSLAILLHQFLERIKLIFFYVIAVEQIHQHRCV